MKEISEPLEYSGSRIEFVWAVSSFSTPLNEMKCTEDLSIPPSGLVSLLLLAHSCQCRGVPFRSTAEFEALQPGKPTLSDLKKWGDFKGFVGRVALHGTSPLLVVCFFTFFLYVYFFDVFGFRPLLDRFSIDLARLLGPFGAGFLDVFLIFFGYT